jgi:hypothetical protein
MTSITFETEIKGNVIEIPEEYRGQLDSKVFVTVHQYTGRSTPPLTIPPRKGGVFTAADFSPPHIDTQGWKFNREEANER